ncbi:hypothetical protein Tco_0550181 [Tanacetum coccineum]
MQKKKERGLEELKETKPKTLEETSFSCTRKEIKRMSFLKGQGSRRMGNHNMEVSESSRSAYTKRTRWHYDSHAAERKDIPHQES